MTKQQKARAHLARAQELLQGYGSSPYNKYYTRATASNEALEFGTNGSDDGTTYNLPYDELPTNIRTMIESELDNEQNWNLHLSAKKFLLHIKLTRLYKKGGWMIMPAL